MLTTCWLIFETIMPKLFLPASNSLCSNVVLSIWIALCLLEGLYVSLCMFMYVLYTSFSLLPSVRHYSTFILEEQHCLCHQALLQTHALCIRTVGMAVISA